MLRFLRIRNLAVIESVEVEFDAIPLPAGRYYLWTAISDADSDRPLVGWHPMNSFDVDGPALDPAPKGVMRLSPVHVVARWRGVDIVDPASGDQR